MSLMEEGSAKPAEQLQKVNESASERELFEKWAVKCGRHIVRSLAGEPAEYMDGCTDAEWQAWQAASITQQEKEEIARRVADKLRGPIGRYDEELVLAIINSVLSPAEKENKQ